MCSAKNVNIIRVKCLDILAPATVSRNALYENYVLLLQGREKVDPRFGEYEVKKLRSLPAAGRRTQFFLFIITEPGVHLLGHPCRERKSRTAEGDFLLQIDLTVAVQLLLVLLHEVRVEWLTGRTVGR